MSFPRSYEKAGPLLPSQEDQDIEAKYSSLVKKKGNKYQQKSNQNKQKPQSIALDQVTSATAQTETTESAAIPTTTTTTAPKVSSRGTDFWDVGFGAGNEQKKVGEKKTPGQGGERRQPKPQNKPNNNQKRGQSQLIIEDTSVRAKIVPKKIPKNAFPTLDGTYEEVVEHKEEQQEQQQEEKQETETPVTPTTTEEPFKLEPSVLKDEHSLVACAFSGNQEPINLSALGENI